MDCGGRVAKLELSVTNCKHRVQLESIFTQFDLGEKLGEISRKYCVSPVSRKTQPQKNSPEADVIRRNLRERKLHRKCRAFADFAFHFDGTLMHLDDLAGDVESEA
jgi:hypothetical protein